MSAPSDARAAAARRVAREAAPAGRLRNDATPAEAGAAAADAAASGCAPASAAAPTTAPIDAGAGLRYGALGLPLAFVALPLYVSLPPHYAAAHGAPLAALGGVLLATRVLDAVLDPWLGQLADHLLDRGPRTAWAATALACGAVALGFALLFTPPQTDAGGLLAWLAAGLLWTTVAYSAASILHQAWGARLGGDAAQRARVVGWREGAALLGVLIASVLPSLAGMALTSAALAVLLAAGVALLSAAPAPRAPRRQRADEACAPPPRGPHEPVPAGAPARVDTAPLATAAGRAQPSRWLPWRHDGFRSLLGIFVLNGIASAIPATLVLFYIRDRLQAPAWEPAFLASYFLAAAASVPLWLRLVRRLGLAGGWMLGMALALAGFAWVSLLGAGDVGAFLAVCVVTGMALGADLTFPPALLAGVVRRAGHGGRAEGAYFGWWQAAAKLNLALAAGLALPLLAAAGYTPGAREPHAQQALVAAYAALPLLMKAAALALLLRHRARHGEDR